MNDISNASPQIVKSSSNTSPFAEKGTNENIANTLSTIALISDFGGAVLGGVEAGVVVFTGAGITAVGCAGGGAFAGIGVAPGCGAGFLTALGFDYAFTNVSSVGVAENVLGAVSAVATVSADFFLGNNRVYLDEKNRLGVSIGKDSIVSVRNGIAGLVPESIFDASLSFSQLKYDIDRAQGTKPGGSIEVIRPEGQYVQDLYNFLVQVYLGDWQ